MTAWQFFLLVAFMAIVHGLTAAGRLVLAVACLMSASGFLAYDVARHL